MDLSTWLTIGGLIVGILGMAVTIVGTVINFKFYRAGVSQLELMRREAIREAKRHAAETINAQMEQEFRRNNTLQKRITRWLTR